MRPAATHPRLLRGALVVSLLLIVPPALHVLLPLTTAAQHRHESPEVQPAVVDLGETHFRTSGSAAAQPTFLRGLLLLHSFEYAAARRAFAEARAIDPSFAMAYWGEAMTHNHPIWGEQDLDAARAVLAALAPTAVERLALAPTHREKGYLAAIERLYGDGGKRERDAAYSEAMGELARRCPDDLDARAFYALSLLGLTGEVRNTANYMRAAGVAEEVYELNKRHPGALHYLIHAYDDPVHAPLGLRAARLYASVAPAASHAQHMPSHIFFALGMWDEAIASNAASMKTARDQNAGGYHPLHWLQHAYLQIGRNEDAARLVAVMEEDVRRRPTEGARSHLAMVRATWLVETRGAGAASMREPVDSSGITAVGPFAGLDLARGLAAVERGDLTAARQALGDLRGRLETARAALRTRGEVRSRYQTVSPEEVGATEVMEQMLDAAIAFAAGDRDTAIRKARQAAAAEDALVFEYGPPATVKPAWELAGERLLEAGRSDEATAAFERVLARYPNRRLTVEGLKRAGAARVSTAEGSIAAANVSQQIDRRFPFRVRGFR
jgi:tetratricopeptide (TPR) repeat protein